MKFFIFLGLFSILSSCSKSTSEISRRYDLPEGLEDCKVYEMSDGMSSLTVIRCPESVVGVSHKSGKTTKHNIVIDGVEYVEKN